MDLTWLAFSPSWEKYKRERYWCSNKWEPVSLYIEKRRNDIQNLFQLLLAAPWPTLGHYCEGSRCHSVLITEFFTFLIQRSLGALEQGWAPKFGQTPSEIYVILNVILILSAIMKVALPIVYWMKQLKSYLSKKTFPSKMKMIAFL